MLSTEILQMQIDDEGQLNGEATLHTKAENLTGDA
jgi:hypothetical protein